MIAEKTGIQKILVDDDLVKAPVYQKVRIDPNVTSLITERDKVAYRQKVSDLLVSRVILTISDD
jgi:hypothetical protein